MSLCKAISARSFILDAAASDTQADWRTSYSPRYRGKGWKSRQSHLCARHTRQPCQMSPSLLYYFSFVSSSQYGRVGVRVCRKALKEQLCAVDMQERLHGGSGSSKGYSKCVHKGQKNEVPEGVTDTGFCKGGPASSTWTAPQLTINPGSFRLVLPCQ